MIYLRFAKELGYTIDQFYGLTEAQVFYLTYAMNESQSEKFKYDASLHGYKVEDKVNIIFTKQDTATLGTHMKNRYKEMMDNPKGRA